MFGTNVAPFYWWGWQEVVEDPVRIEDLFPSAAGLFRRRPGRGRSKGLRLFAWVVAGALATLAGRQLVYWTDRNI